MGKWFPISNLAFKIYRRLRCGRLQPADYLDKKYKTNYSGAGMESRTPIEALRKLELDLPGEFAAFLVVCLDKPAVIWTSKVGTMYWLMQLYTD